MLKKLFYYVLAFMAVGLAGYAYYGYLYLKPGTLVTPEMAQVYQATMSNTFKIRIHAFSAGLALMIGIPQLSRRWREKYPKLNVVFRNIYFTSVIFGSLSGFALAFIAQGGLPNLFGFWILSFVWLSSCLMAMWAIYQNDMPNYRLWIVRNYMLTSTAINLRILLGLWTATHGGVESIPPFYQTLGFLTWVPTFIVTEWIILRKIK
jgi:hypothetical protein